MIVLEVAGCQGAGKANPLPSSEAATVRGLNTFISFALTPLWALDCYLKACDINVLHACTVPACDVLFKWQLELQVA